MLDDYFSIEISPEGSIVTLPVLLDDFVPDVLRMDIAQWLIEALTPILTALAELDPSFDLVEFDFGQDGGSDDTTDDSPWPDGDSSCPEDADRDIMGADVDEAVAGPGRARDDRKAFGQIAKIAHHTIGQRPGKAETLVDLRGN